MANKRIKELVEKSSFAAGDYFPIDNENGTKKVDGAKIVTPLGNISGNSDEYSSTKAYKVGDLVIHDNVLYKCKTACSAGSWNANQSCFEAKTLASVVTQLNSELTWKYLTSFNTSSSQQVTLDISLPSDAHEIYIVEIIYGTNIHFPKWSSDVTSPTTLTNGWSEGGDNGSCIYIGITSDTTKIVSASLFQNGSRIVGTCKIYYK